MKPGLSRAAVAAVPLLMLVPRVAQACPSCAGNDDGGWGVLVAMGAMIALPFALAAAVVPYIRRGPRS